MKIDIKKILLNLIPVLVFLLVLVIFYRPIISEGKSFPIHDVKTSYQMQSEIHKYEEGIWWTNSSFGGMPTIMIYPPFKISLPRLISATFFGMNPFSISFMAMFFTYLGLRAIRLDWIISGFLAICYGLMSLNVILIEAGHFNKILTMIFIFPMLAASYRLSRQFSWGQLLLFTFSTALGVMYGHYQILYYLIFIYFFFGLFVLYKNIQNKTSNKAFIFGACLIFGAMVGLGMNLDRFLTTYEYSKETIRGKSELSSKNQSDGLDYDYVFAWSPGKMESFSLLFPEFSGGKSKALVSERGSDISRKFSQLAQQGKIPQDKIQQTAQLTTTYWGQKSFSAGPTYLGIVLVYLAFLGLFIARGGHHIWIWASMIFLLLLSWGPYFKSFNIFMFEHFPYYNKFRDTSSCLNMLESLVMLGAGISFYQFFFAKKYSDEEKLNAWKLGSMAFGAIILVALIITFMVTPSLKNDAAFGSGINELLEMVYAERMEIARGDIFRGAFITLLAAGLLYASIQNKLKSTFAIAGIGLLALIDIVQVTTRYVNEDSYVAKRQNVLKTQPTKADEIIMKDPAIHYRVLDVSRGNPLSSADASAFHKSIGGYHAAKLMIFQEFADKYILDKEQGRYTFFEHLDLLGMLNTKYIIQNPNQPNLNDKALGNAWFVNDIQFVPNADQELSRINDIDPVQTAVVQERFKSMIGTNGQATASDKIELTSYHPDKMEYKYSLGDDRVALFSEMYYKPSKGWKVYLDGQEIDEGFFKANYILRGMHLPKGEHTLVFVFEPSGHKIGRILSIFFTVLFLGAVFMGVKEKTSKY